MPAFTCSVGSFEVFTCCVLPIVIKPSMLSFKVTSVTGLNFCVVYLYVFICVYNNYVMDARWNVCTVCWLYISECILD